MVGNPEHWVRACLGGVDARALEGHLVLLVVVGCGAGGYAADEDWYGVFGEVGACVSVFEGGGVSGIALLTFVFEKRGGEIGGRLLIWGLDDARG